MEVNGVWHWVCAGSFPGVGPQGPVSVVNQPSGRQSLLGASLGREAHAAFGHVRRSPRGRIYSRAERGLRALQIERKSGSKLLPLTALLLEWIRG